MPHTEVANGVSGTCRKSFRVREMECLRPKTKSPKSRDDSFPFSVSLGFEAVEGARAPVKRISGFETCAESLRVIDFEPIVGMTQLPSDWLIPFSTARMLLPCQDLLRTLAR